MEAYQTAHPARTEYQSLWLLFNRVGEVRTPELKEFRRRRKDIDSKISRDVFRTRTEQIVPEIHALRDELTAYVEYHNF